ncbi:unnamed protein product [Heterobilharzia americana]|nr:unnamed protein product [Heterobilharzia americana]
MRMELLVEMHSNLSAAHFNERRANQCMKIGNVEGAICYYRKSIAFMELAREEVEEEDHDFVVIDLQLSALKLSLSEAVSKKTAILSREQNTILKPTAKVQPPASRKLSDPLSLSSNRTSEEKEKVNAVKLPKTEFQTHEELVTCIEELRKLVDVLTSQLGRVRQMLTEERERRLAIEAELISSGAYVCQSSKCFSYHDYDDNDDGFDENRPCIFTDLSNHTCITRNQNSMPSIRTDSPTQDRNIHQSLQELSITKASDSSQSI